MQCLDIEPETVVHAAMQIVGRADTSSATVTL
jgi:hypothetical protein